MEGDRGTTLIFRAAVQGVVDFSKARFFDPSWWTYLALVFDELHEETNRDIHKLLFQHQLALLSSGSLSADNFKKVQTDARESFDRISNSLQPWLRQWLLGQRKTMEEDMVSLYQREIGNMNDPEFRQKMLDEAKRISEMDKGTKAEPKSELILNYERVKKSREAKQQAVRDRRKGR